MTFLKLCFWKPKPKFWAELGELMTKDINAQIARPSFMRTLIDMEYHEPKSVVERIVVIAPPPTEMELKTELLRMLERYDPATQTLMAQAIHEGKYVIKEGYAYIGARDDSDIPQTIEYPL